MDDRTIARGIAAGRLAFGLGVMIAPRLLTRRVGGRDDPPAPYVWWLRAFGIRDAVLGAGTLAALGDPDETAAVRWVQAGALADSADAITAVVYGRDLDRVSRRATLALAIPASALGWKAAAGMAARR